MGLAARLARRGTGSTYPNPCVGAVVVKAGRVLGAGRSAPTGGPHAEVRALREAGDGARGATVYVTLEPCSHHGRTPPCTDALVEAGVSEVVYGVRDPAGHASGRARERLEAAGVEVREGILGERCRRVHAHYLHHETTRRPFVALKVAASLDGQIACSSGDSRWITGEAARTYGHRLRARYHGIAIGVGTLLADDPRLSVRLVHGTDPVPIVFDSALRCVAGEARPQLLRAGTLVLHGPQATATAREALAVTGAEGIEVATGAGGRIDVDAALVALGRRPIRSLLVEGGGRLLGSFVGAGAWQRLFLFHAPRLLGAGIPAIADVGWSTVAQAPHPQVIRRRRLGDDLLTVLGPRER
jgi:diaminohydroxyphosphoribosylaminopyrimidine deaminase/5-amino-6-(5-phosphoribosylamino)uracil reductase